MPSPVETPPPEPFWQKYSNRHEFPLSTVGAVLIHVVSGAFIVFVLFGLANREPERAAVPMQFLDAFDDNGDGAKTPGGDDTLTRGESKPFEMQAPEDVIPNSLRLPLPISGELPDLPLVRDPDADGEAAADNSRLNGLDKLLPKGPPGGNRGVGEKKGNGPAGADSTGARNMRWVLRFRTTDGQDYINQLAVMGATIVVPVPPANKDILYFPDLKNLKTSRNPTKDDTRQIAAQVKFSDSREGSVDAVTGVLKLDFKPKVFWAVFPKAVEEELDRKERAYRNRSPEDIQETAFRVTVKDGQFQITVDDQKIKR